MKRSGLLRRAPMKRRGKQIRPVSDRALAERGQRADTRAAVIERDRTCRIGPAINQLLTESDDDARRAGFSGSIDIDYEPLALQARRCRPWEAGDVHEPGGRARDIGSHLDSARAVLACRSCHDFCHDHPRLARLVGGYTSSY